MFKNCVLDQIFCFSLKNKFVREGVIWCKVDRGIWVWHTSSVLLPFHISNVVAFARQPCLFYSYLSLSIVTPSPKPPQSFVSFVYYPSTKAIALNPLQYKITNTVSDFVFACSKPKHTIKKHGTTSRNLSLVYVHAKNSL